MSLHIGILEVKFYTYRVEGHGENMHQRPGIPQKIILQIIRRVKVGAKKDNYQKKYASVRKRFVSDQIIKSSGYNWLSIPENCESRNRDVGQRHNRRVDISTEKKYTGSPAQGHLCIENKLRIL
jgi:hypothetical protein